MMDRSTNHGDHWSSQNIINKLPYSAPFLFVEEIISVSDDGITGTYTFAGNAYFYQGHFKNNPVTPGVILTECMAQIGLVCLGIFLLGKERTSKKPKIALSSTDMEFYIPVLPNEKVTVVSEKIYFRLHKLKCKVKMLNDDGKLVAKGIISGMMTDGKQKPRI